MSDNLNNNSVGKIAIITGNNTGLGKAISDQLSKLGFKEPDIIRSKDFDIKKQEDAHRLVDMTLQKYGRIDLLVNNVGNYINKPLSQFSLEEWHEMMDSNLNSAFYLCLLALPELRKTKGRILNIGYASMEKLNPSPNVAAYQIAKTGLLLLTKALAKEEARNGVTVNMLSPGHMENTIDHGFDDKIPLGRLAKLDEAVEAAFFLINSQYITGQNLEIAGGWGL